MGDYPTGTVTFVFTDVVDSSRLWEEHPDEMHTAMAAHDQIVKEAAAANSGVLVKQTGDGAHLVFPSANDAVAAAIAIQEALKEPELILEVRIGVHTGEARLRDGDYYGQVVNRAARVMSIAEGGQVLVSLATEELVRDHLAEGSLLLDLGERDLQGLSRPEHVFELITTGPGQERSVGPSSFGPDDGKARRAAWIAVLPFENMSGDADQDYFAHGIAEDVITGLAAWSTLRVIARTSSFRYEGADVDRIAEELSVRYVLEGSVRRSGDRVRVTAQLIDATGGGHHVWAERYDADMVDIFEVQDQITRSIVVAIDPAIRQAETGSESGAETKSLDAWDHVQLGRSETYKFKADANLEAIGHFTSALAIDPNYSVAWSELAFAHFVDGWFNFVETPNASIDLAYEEAKRALELDERDAMAHATLAFVNLGMGRLDAMAAAATRAIELNPSLAYGYLALGDAKLFAGEHDEGVRMIDEAIALSPHDPGAVFFYGARAIGHLLAHRYDEAADDARAALKLRYGYVLGRVLLTSALAHMDNLEQAHSELEKLLEVKPDFTPVLLDPYPMSEEDRKHILDGLYTAGFFEGS